MQRTVKRAQEDIIIFVWSSFYYWIKHKNISYVIKLLSIKSSEYSYNTVNSVNTAV